MLAFSQQFVLEAFHKAVAKRSGSAVLDASVEWEQLHDSESGNPFWHNTRTPVVLHRGDSRSVDVTVIKVP